MKQIIVALAAAMLCSACVVGPDFKRPDALGAKAYAPAPLPAATASAPQPFGAAQRFDAGRDVPAQWWTLFRSPTLSRLIERALAANPTIEAARASLRQAQENVYAQQGYFFPTVQASYGVSRTKVSGNTGGNAPGIQGNGTVISTYQGTPAAQGGTPPYTAPVIYNFHTAELTVGYTPDVFGGQRRQVESLQAQADAQRFELEAADLTIASNVAAAAIQAASLRAQLDATHAMIDAQARSLELVRRQHELGYTSGLDVAAAQSALDQLAANVAPLERQIDQTRDLLRVLVGAAQDQDVETDLALDDFHLPEDLPLSLPSQLVRQRPDVRAAEAQLHAANAAVGIAIANRFPQFSISGNVGGNATIFSQMFDSAGKFFALSGQVSHAVFDGGTLKHQQLAAEAALDAAGAQYRGTVLVAFQNVADTLHALHTDAAALETAGRAEQTAKLSLQLTRRQFELGAVNMQTVLGAEQAYQQAVFALVQAQASRLGDTAALFEALGGGWWNRMDGGETPLRSPG
ncbi:MAG: efflux transporter outer membrane subunit [Paucibacter sp.]|nr:efflux transporter outer membrane subunit [Roseateles sp.]